jgi:hypothetical protein
VKAKFLMLIVLAVSTIAAQNNMLHYSPSGNAEVNVGTKTVSENYTVEFWFNASTFDNNPPVLMAYSSLTFQSTFAVEIRGGTSFSLYRKVGGTIAADVSFGVNEWHHIACAVSSTRYTLYFDGNIVASGTNMDITTLFEQNDLLKIGGDWQPYNGYLDEIRIWNVTRTTAEIRSTMMKELSGAESGLFAYYNCNETSGTTLHDAASNHLDAELTGSVGFTSATIPSTMLYQGYPLNVTATTATLNGSYYPNGSVSQCYFEYGTTTSYGTVTSVQNIPATGDIVAYSQNLSGLSPQTSYHFRTVFIIGTDTTRTPDAPFITLPLAPTVQASNVTVTGKDPQGVTVHWTNGNGQKRLVLLRESSAVTAAPITASSYTASDFLGDGARIGTGNHVIYAGNADSATVDNLKEGTTYHAAVFEFNDGNGSAPPAYLSPGSVASGVPTTLLAPTVPSSQFTIVDTSATRVIIRVNKGNGNGRIVVVKEGRNPTAMPVVNTSYNSSDKNYSDGDVLNDDSSYVVYADEDSVITIVGLDEQKTYTISVFEYNKFSNDLIKYFPVPVSDTVTTKRHQFIVTASRPTNITSTGATLRGTLFTNGIPSDIYFWYTTTIGSSGHETFALNGLSGYGTEEISQSVTGLTGSTIYYVQARAQNIDNQLRGSDTLVFMTYASSPLLFGSAVKFDGVNDHASTTVPVSAIDNIAVEARVKWNGATAGSQCILYNGDPSYNGYGLYLFNSNGWKISVLAGGVTDVFADATLPIGEWTHLALVRSAGIWTLYINGVATPMTYNNFSPNYASGNLYIGGIGGGDPFNGAIDEVRMWNTARTASDISDNMNFCFTSAPAGLAGYWQFNENSGSTVYDLAGANDLTLGNFNFNETDGWMDSSAPLPVEMTSFTVSAKQLNAELKWSTATEVNNAGFEVERKLVSRPGGQAGFTSQVSGEIPSSLKLETSNSDWTRIAFVDGAGSSNTAHEYSYTDRSISAGTYAFRLKQIDRDGKFTYSKTVEVTASIPYIFSLEQNYPNPFNPSTSIEYQLPSSGKVKLSVFDALGREVAVLVDEVKDAGRYSVRFDGTQRSSGIYYARLSSGGMTSVKKMLLVK